LKKGGIKLPLPDDPI